MSRTATLYSINEIGMKIMEILRGCITEDDPNATASLGGAPRPATTYPAG